MLYIESVQDHSSENETKSSCKWKFSFSLQTKNRKYFLFARTEEEQFLWLTAFYRLVKVQVVDMKYQPSVEIKKLYSHKVTNLHFRVRDDDESHSYDREVEAESKMSKAAVCQTGSANGSQNSRE